MKHTKIRSKETCRKLSEANKEYYSKTPKEIKQLRWDKIGKAHLKHFTPEEINKINDVISWGYIIDDAVILKQAGIADKSPKVLQNYIKNGIIEKTQPLKFIPKFIQLWPKDKWDSFIADSEVLDHRKLSEKYNVGEKTLLRFRRNITNFRWGKIEWLTYRKQTKPEKLVESILLSNNISYKKEKYIDNMNFRVDFLIKGTKIIEVQGDFFHANPRVFDYTKLCEIQKKNVLRDIEKKRKIKELGLDFLEIWEKDIKEDINKVEKIIIDYVK